MQTARRNVSDELLALAALQWNVNTREDGPALQRAGVSTPQTRRVANIQVVPTAISSSSSLFVVPTNPNVAAFSNVNLARQEEIQVEAIGTGAAPLYAFLFLQDRFAPVPAGSRYWVRFSGSYTVNSNKWQSAPFTFEDGTVQTSVI